MNMTIDIEDIEDIVLKIILVLGVICIIMVEITIIWGLGHLLYVEGLKLFL